MLLNVLAKPRLTWTFGSGDAARMDAGAVFTAATYVAMPPELRDVNTTLEVTMTPWLLCKEYEAEG